ncbi:MAG: LPXTG cell wall anchor domain-containing protein, partial [Clostridia bacterium]|nr:LPXTG cell wall anchor domain-containing protein [Clostridia bacterium]
NNGYRIDYFYNPELTEISFCIPPELANVIKGKDMSISGIIAEIIDPEWSGVYHAYDNHVTVSYGDTVIGHADQTQKVKHTVIKKTAGGVIDGNTVPYSIVINPSASDLDPASAVLAVTDMLSYTPPAGTVMNASLSSVVIYALSTGDRGEEIRTDITSACSYTMDESAEGGKQTYTVRFKVPDSTSIRIDYEYQFSGKGKVHDLTNVAMVEGGYTGSDKTKNELDIIIQDADSGVVAVGINVHKVDSENYTVTLGGAEFKLEKWTGQSWDIVKNPIDPEHGFVTDETHGMFNTGALENNTAYRLTELKAPPGYEMRTATTYEFYIKSSDSSSIVKPEDFNGKALNNGDNFYITNDAVRYDLPSTGGNGTVHYELIGSMILLFVFLYSLRLKKRQTKHEIKK